MNEVTKLKLQAVISSFAADRDEAYSAILQILESDSLEPVKDLRGQFKKLAKAENMIIEVQKLYNNLENLETIKKADSDDNSSENNS